MSGFLDTPSPRWFTIGAHRPFLEDLAAGIWKTLAPLGPEALPEAVILIPTRRASRSLAEAFLKAVQAAGGAAAVLLPRIRALGDLDEGEPPFEAGDIALGLPAAISPWRRRFELARLVVENEDLLERRLDAGSALELADALAAFLDGCQIEETGDPAAVEALVEGELARHWQVSAKFLNLALEAWPRRLAELGLMDVAERRVALLRALGSRWRDHPPAGSLIAAGSTGAAPAAADLLAAIAQAPSGCVVLPGLDKSLADTAWEEVDEAHPQGAMKRLLERSGIVRSQVRFWDAAEESDRRGRWRRRVISEALRPPNATADWLNQIEALRAEGTAAGVDSITEGLAGLAALTAGGEEEAASVAALLLREALETPGKTAALVTPDAALARRVSARLTRWNITADSSAGQPLAAAPVAVLASLVARATADPSDPVTLLGIVKHPLTRLGLGEEPLERARRALERYGLRGPRPGDWDALTARLENAVGEDAGPDEAARARAGALAEAIDLAARLRAALDLAEGPFAGEAAPAAHAASALAAALESLASAPRAPLGDLWSGQAGECAAGLFAALLGESGGLPDVTRAGFAQLLDALMAGELVRPGGASHPRLRILGVLEARLIRADRLILAGLEEGVWPRAAPIDPFLSRPMRARLGLPPPERRIGLSAHDFAQAAAAPEVFLINTERRAGAPAVASRWLWRLRTLAKGADVELPGRPEMLAWARDLDAPLSSPPAALRTATRPRPIPPLKARPRKMSVTAVERWVRDPYAIYARDILKLRPLAVPDEPIEALARGSAIHAAFERFAREHPDTLPDDAEDRFAAMVIEELGRAGMPLARMTREHALAANVAPWVIAFEGRRRPGARLIVETQGEHVFDAPGGPFKLTARADRIEARGDVADILDFKTGATPTAKQMRAGLSPQLTLTGAILAHGGFPDLGAARPGELLYVRISGGRIPGREEVRGGAGESEVLADAALEGLKRRVAWFDNADTPYPSWAAPQFIGRQGGDYDHLARVWEWHVIGEGESEGGE
jgi:ATP-dependent helicase/nuclease subunit B